jgi:hypothetical protein
MNDTDTDTAAELQIELDTDQELELEEPAAPRARIVIDPDDLTLDEVEEVEELMGEPIDTLFSPGRRRAAALKAVLLVIRRRDDPEATLASVGSVKLSELTLLGE